MVSCLLSGSCSCRAKQTLAASLPGRQHLPNSIVCMRCWQDPLVAERLLLRVQHSTLKEGAAAAFRSAGSPPPS